MMRTLTLASAAAAVLLASSVGWSQVVCTSCAGCTAALASADVAVELGRDISWDGRGACVTIRGANAAFDGHEHAIRSRTPGQGEGVRVSAADVSVHNLHVLHAADGIVVERADRATLFHNGLQVRGTAVRITRSRGVRVVRGVILGGERGIVFGDLREGRCPPDATVTSPEAVVQRMNIDGAGVGIAACEALPVLIENTVRRGGVGVLLGTPSPGAGAHAASPWDPCVCGAALPAVRPTSTLFYTSGCSSCQVHEAWIPEVRRGGADVLSRDSNNDHTEEQRRFDRYATRCAPDLIDVLGIPGCVPNYACAATGRASKERNGDRELTVASAINAPQDLRAFADACRTAAAAGYFPDARCVRAQLQRNEICDNREVDVRAPGAAARFGGVGDACGRVDGFRDTGASAGCDRPCGEAPPPPALPAARAEQAAFNEPSTPAAAPEPSAASVSSSSTTATAAPAGPPADPSAPAPSAAPTLAPATPARTPARPPPGEDGGPFGYVLLALLAGGAIGAIVRGRFGGDQPRS